MRPSEKAWLAIAGFVVGYNLLARDGEMLSEKADDWDANRPWLSKTIITLVAVHLANAVPPALDPIHWLFLVSRAVSRRTSLQNA